MEQTMQAKFGAWESPITEETLVEDVKQFKQVLTHGGALYWIEGRPSEGGRNVIMRCVDGKIEELLQHPYNARTRVHEYGGSNMIATNESILFSNDVDQGIYQLEKKGASPLLVKEHWRFADGVYDARRERIYCVGEHHRSDSNVMNCIISYDLKSKEMEVVAQGDDFYAAPRLSPDCSQLAFISWNHPNMPWDGSNLYLASLDDVGRIESKKLVAGGEEESICEPQFSPEGTLHFVSDKTGFWNLYRHTKKTSEPLLPMEAEFSRPHWVFGRNSYVFFEDQIACIYTINGFDYLGMLDCDTLEFNQIDLPFCTLVELHTIGSSLAFIAGQTTKPTALVTFDLNTMKLTKIREASEPSIDPKYYSIPETIEYPTSNNRTAFGIYYPPCNPDYEIAKGSLPPLVVKCHGGPSSQASPCFDLSVQYWTSRGFALLDLNYSGSTGFGRAYRNRLWGQWGVCDVDDACNGAKFLADKGLVDPSRMAVKGGSAGGYTTLAALTQRDTFSAGASYYGVSDLCLLAEDTHKFEAHYLDRLIGPYPEKRELYVERSPITHKNNLSCPIIILQGADDKVVPPSQAEEMYNAIIEKGIKSKYVLFEGEQHGFRQSETIKRAISEELQFYREVFALNGDENAQTETDIKKT